MLIAPLQLNLQRAARTMIIAIVTCHATNDNEHRYVLYYTECCFVTEAVFREAKVQKAVRSKSTFQGANKSACAVIS